MRKLAIVSVLSALAVLSVAAPSAKLTAFATKLKSSSVVRATYSVQNMEGDATTYNVVLARPNMVKIDTPERKITADGKMITTFIKATKQYFTKTQNDAELNGLFKGDDLKVWSLFFNEKAFDNYTMSDQPDATRKGTAMSVVRVVLDASKGRSISLFIDKKDDLAKQATMDEVHGEKKMTRLLDVTSVAVQKADEVNESTFAFKAPEGSTEIQESDLISTEWIYDLDEAKAVAAKTGRMVLIDFWATWCGPCKAMAATVFPTQQFKELASKYVFCKIDVDAQKETAEMFKITAMPTTVILDKDGAELGRFVGWGGAANYFKNVEDATAGKSQS